MAFSRSLSILLAPSVSSVRVPGSVLCTGLVPGGSSRQELAPGGLQSPGFVAEKYWASVWRALPVMSYKPMQRYSRKLRGSRFLKMDESIIVEAVYSFGAPAVSSGVGKVGASLPSEVTPRKVKGRRELKNLECSIKYDAKGASTRRGRCNLLVF